MVGNDLAKEMTRAGVFLRQYIKARNSSNGCLVPSPSSLFNLWVNFTNENVEIVPDVYENQDSYRHISTQFLLTCFFIQLAFGALAARRTSQTDT